LKKLLLANICLVLAGTLSAAPKKSTLPAPATISCVGDCDNASVTWGAVDGASAYSVEFVAGYDTDADTVVDTTDSFTYPVVPQNGNVGDQTFSTPYADFEQDFGAGAIAPVTLVVHVKALNPPKKGGAQSNPFTAFCDVLASKACGTPYCHSIVGVLATCLAPEFCVYHPISPTSSADAKAACEACFGVGNCTHGFRERGAWKSGATVYYYDAVNLGLCISISATAGDIIPSFTCAISGRWAP
jgi:hypothetical protein